ncbi:MAG: hypothetical protein H0V04_07370, partial [Chloroflexi bacterium]|nr:hypothetical protein [Chloroflexota bacterium]
MPKVTMPQLGESVAEGTIGKWLKQPGDKVAKYEPIVEVITDKVNAEVPSPFEGTLTEILVQEGETVPNNTEIAVIESAGEAAGDAAGDSSAGEASAAPEESAAPDGSTKAAVAPDESATSTDSEPTVLGTGGHGPGGSDERPADETRRDPGIAPTATAEAPPATGAGPTNGAAATNGTAAVAGYTGRMT